MSCKNCKKGDLLSILHSKCVQDALDTIGQHFLVLKTELEEKNNEIKLYANHNERLAKVVSFLQCEKKHGGERRKGNDEDCSAMKSSISKRNFESGKNKSVSINSPPSPSSNLDLNLALNSEQLQDVSNISSTQETIAETEKTCSPLKTSLLSARRTLLREVNREEQRTENSNSINRFVGSIGKQTCRGINKPRQNLKQTKLQFDVKSVESNTDDIEASPNLYSSLQKARLRSFCQRSNMELNCKVTPKKFHSKQKSSSKTIASDNQTANISELFFDFSKTIVGSPALLPLSPKTSKLKATIASSQSSSVLLLTPMTQDIVFIDDSQELDCSLNSVKHFEEKTDKKIFKHTINKRKTETGYESKLQGAESGFNGIKKEPVSDDLEETRLEENRYTNDHKHNVSKGFNLYQARSHKRKLYEDDDFVQPIEVKRESDIPKKKLSLKKHLSMCCDDCEKYLKFFGAKFSDRQVEDHLQNCKHRKEQERLGHITPPGFWNPLMESFPEGDPRNEVQEHHLFKNINENN